MQENAQKILDKASEMIADEIDATQSIVELNKVVVAGKMLNDKLEDKDYKLKKEQADNQKVKDEKELEIKVRCLTLDEYKVHKEIALKEQELKLRETENKIKVFTIAGTIIVAVITVTGNVIKQIISIKHANDIYDKELYQNYHDHVIETPTQKDIARFAMQDSLKN